jgi:hypothetical protein
MAYEGSPQICIPGAVSGADLSAATVAFKFVKFSTAPMVVLCNATTDMPCGVIQAPTTTSATGLPVQVVALGVTKVQGDGSATVGDLIGCNADGRARTNAWTTDKTKFIAGVIINRDAAGAAGSLLTAAINCIAPPKAVQSA